MFGNYTDRLDEFGKELKAGEKLDLKNAPFDPLACFPISFETPGICKAVFAGLTPGSKNPILYNGMDVLHLSHKNSMTISWQQFQSLQKAQPRFKESDNVIFPVSRTAGRL